MLNQRKIEEKARREGRKYIKSSWDEYFHLRTLVVELENLGYDTRAFHRKMERVAEELSKMQAFINGGE